MANQEHLDILKQGVESWNQWKKANPTLSPDLSGADLSNMNLEEVNFNMLQFRGGNLSKAHIHGADLSGANFEGANLSNAILSFANLLGTNFSRVNFSGAYLVMANLTRTDLRMADFSRAVVGYTIFGDVDLSLAKGLDSVNHTDPSTVGVDTIYHSKGNIPEVFLRGAGVPDSFITYARSLIGKPIDFYSCFISYSSRDEAFAKRLYADLQSNGVRCWFAPEDLKIGDKLRPRIDESIRLHDRMLLVLSEHSIASQWVEQEVERALARERKENKVVLFPIRLDKAVMDIEEGWPALIRNTRNIGDFTRWKRHDAYQKGFVRLLRDLKAES